MNCHDHLLCMIYETCIKSSFLMSSLTSVFWFHYTFITNRNPALTRVNVWMDTDKDKQIINARTVIRFNE